MRQINSEKIDINTRKRKSFSPVYEIDDHMITIFLPHLLPFHSNKLDMSCLHCPVLNDCYLLLLLVN